MISLITLKQCEWQISIIVHKVIKLINKLKVKQFMIKENKLRGLHLHQCESNIDSEKTKVL